MPETVREKIRTQAGDQSGYCRSLQKYVLGLLEIEHIIPKAKGGTGDQDNLWLACGLCNSYKGTQTDAIDPVTGRRVKLFNPRKQEWSGHFHTALGQYLNYRAVLQMQQPHRKLYLAVSIDIYRNFFRRDLPQLSMQIYQLKLIVFDPVTEVIVQWIN